MSRVWWASSDRDLPHTLGQLALECEAAGTKVHTLGAMPENGQQMPLLVWK